MCGIVGVSLGSPSKCAVADVLEAVLLLQHRGQDACGVVMSDKSGVVTSHKGAGLVTDVFGRGLGVTRSLRGSFGIGHVRYTTNGGYTDLEIQPIVARDHGHISIAHNGNLQNCEELGSCLDSLTLRERQTLGDSELMLSMFLSKQAPFEVNNLSEQVPGWIISGLEEIYTYCVGSFACILFIPSYGLVGFRDVNGIKPLILGEKKSPDGKESDYMFASESVAVRNLGYSVINDVRPGEAIFIPSRPPYTQHSRLFARQLARSRSYSPDIFEYVYFARAESVIDGISVNKSRRFMGEALAQMLMKELTTEGALTSDEIDCVVPVPDTSITSALAVSQHLNKPMALGLVRNQFIFRTFILPTQERRVEAVNRKFSMVQEELEGKNVLIVDDSIVRGTTAARIVSMAKKAGAKKVYLASTSPEIRFKHIHGINLADESKLIARGRSNPQIQKALGCDGVFYLSLAGLIASCLRARCHGNTSSFEVGMFSGKYITQ